jgi:tetratricopeptide (TPR) repeat protein
MAESNRLQRHILYHNLACVYREARQPVDAEKAYLEAASLYPDAPDTQLGLGLLYEADLKQPDKARACFERFLALAPESPAAGEVRSRIGRLDGQANAAEAAK